MLETKIQRFWFAIAAVWFGAWTAVHTLSAFSPAGFKFVGWLMFALVPILLVWGVVIAISGPSDISMGR